MSARFGWERITLTASQFEQLIDCAPPPLVLTVGAGLVERERATGTATYLIPSADAARVREILEGETP